MISIADNIKALRQTLPDGITLVAVSKTKPLEDIMEAYSAGHRTFGENRVQEIIDKHPSLPDDLCLHMIGHLQTNKVKYIVDKVDMIEGVDSLKLLRVVDREAQKKGVKVKILLQFHIAEEDTKFGFSLDEVKNLFDSGEIEAMHGIEIRGVMGMATFTDDMEKVRSEFRYLSTVFRELKSIYNKDNPVFKEISMGMSGDYEIALDEGSTMIRVGSAIFGARNIKK